MRNAPVGVIGGIDCHTDQHVAATLDPLGRLLGTRAFPATSAGYRRGLAWLRTFGPITAVGVESTGSYGAALARYLKKEGIRVVEINQPHRHTKARPAVDGRQGRRSESSSGCAVPVR